MLTARPNASPDYIHADSAPERVASHLPGVKLILLLRDPVGRAYSEYGMRQRLGREQRRWEDIVDEEISEMPLCPLSLEAVRENGGSKQSHRGYLLGSVVLPFLQRWLESFPPDRFLILQNAEMLRDTVGTVRRAYRFLELPDFVPDCSERRNVGDYEPMDPVVRERLTTWFAPHQAALGELLASLVVVPEPDKGTA